MRFEPQYTLSVRRPVLLMRAMVEILLGNSYMSLEGDLSKLDQEEIKDLLPKSPMGLRRHTHWPRQGFVVLLIEPQTAQVVKNQVLPRIGLRTRVLHVEIAKSNIIEFASYDNFYEGCVWVGSSVPRSVLDELVKARVLRSYEPV